MPCFCVVFCFFKQKTAYEIYQCDWSSDVCSSDLVEHDDVIVVDRRLIKPSLSILSDVDRIAILTQALGDHSRHACVVFDYEYPHKSRSQKAQRRQQKAQRNTSLPNLYFCAFCGPLCAFLWLTLAVSCDSSVWRCPPGARLRRSRRC